MGHPSDPSHDVTGSAVRGVFWVGGGQVIRQVVGILTYIILARLLVPDDFGLFRLRSWFLSVSRAFLLISVLVLLLCNQKKSLK